MNTRDLADLIVIRNFLDSQLQGHSRAVTGQNKRDVGAMISKIDQTIIERALKLDFSEPAVLFTRTSSEEDFKKSLEMLAQARVEENKAVVMEAKVDAAEPELMELKPVVETKDGAVLVQQPVEVPVEKSTKKAPKGKIKRVDTE